MNLDLFFYNDSGGRMLYIILIPLIAFAGSLNEDGYYNSMGRQYNKVIDRNDTKPITSTPKNLVESISNLVNHFYGGPGHNGHGGAIDQAILSSKKDFARGHAFFKSPMMGMGSFPMMPMMPQIPGIPPAGIGMATGMGMFNMYNNKSSNQSTDATIATTLSNAYKQSDDLQENGPENDSLGTLSTGGSSSQINSSSLTKSFDNNTYSSPSVPFSSTGQN